MAELLHSPDVFDFHDAREYLCAAFAQLREARGEGFSLRALSRRFNIPSVATLSMILTGKRGITAPVADKCVEILKLKGARRRYFVKLIELSRTADMSNRTLIEEQLLFIRKLAKSEPLSLKQYEFLSQWYFVPIYVLVSQPGFIYDPCDIASRLGRGMTAEKVRRAIATMVALGLLSEDGDTLKISPGSTVKTAEDVRNISIRRFQMKMMELARLAFAMAPEKRELTCLTFSFPPEALPAMKDKIRQFREELDQYANQFGTGGEVYQLNVQLFPLTESKKEKRA
jgi:uncharacterized protein (TIGR02147 family)